MRKLDQIPDFLRGDGIIFISDSTGKKSDYVITEKHRNFKTYEDFSELKEYKYKVACDLKEKCEDILPACDFKVPFIYTKIQSVKFPKWTTADKPNFLSYHYSPSNDLNELKCSKFYFVQYNESGKWKGVNRRQAAAREFLSKEKDIVKLLSEVRNINFNSFEIDTNFVEAYEEYDGQSCMSASKAGQFYDALNKANNIRHGEDLVRIITRRNEYSEIIGRALLWNMKYIDGIPEQYKNNWFIERSYPSDNYNYIQDMEYFGEINGYFHKCGSEIKNTIIKLGSTELDLYNCSIKNLLSYEPAFIPFQDTFYKCYNDTLCCCEESNLDNCEESINFGCNGMFFYANPERICKYCNAVIDEDNYGYDYDNYCDACGIYCNYHTTVEDPRERFVTVTFRDNTKYTTCTFDTINDF